MNADLNEAGTAPSADVRETEQVHQLTSSASSYVGRMSVEHCLSGNLRMIIETILYLVISVSFCSC